MYMQNSNFNEWSHIAHNTYVPVLFISVNNTQSSPEWGFELDYVSIATFSHFKKSHINRKTSTPIKNRLSNWTLNILGQKFAIMDFGPKKITFSCTFNVALLLISFYTYWRYFMQISYFIHNLNDMAKIQP